MLKVFSSVLLSAAIMIPAVSVASPVSVKVDPKEIDALLDGWHPKTGTVKENDQVWCVSNDWKFRDTMHRKMKGGERFSRSTALGSMGAKWFCFFKD